METLKQFCVFEILASWLPNHQPQSWTFTRNGNLERHVNKNFTRIKKIKKFNPHRHVVGAGRHSPLCHFDKVNEQCMITSHDRHSRGQIHTKSISLGKPFNCDDWQFSISVSSEEHVELLQGRTDRNVTDI